MTIDDEVKTLRECVKMMRDIVRFLSIRNDILKAPHFLIAEIDRLLASMERDDT